MEPCLPVATWEQLGHHLGGYSLHCALYHFRAAFSIMLTSLTGNKDYLGESFLKVLRKFG